MQVQRMKFVKVIVFVMAIVGQSAATGGGSGTGHTNVNYGAGRVSSATFGSGSSDRYGGGSSFTSSGISRTTATRKFSGEFGQNLQEAPRRNKFDYQSADEKGNSHYHRQEADGSGTVSGSYGYNDVQGLYRVVDYIADVNGFRASIRTNEPGTDGKESPADVQMTVHKPPFFITDRYTPSDRIKAAHPEAPFVSGGFVKEIFEIGETSTPSPYIID